MKLTKCYHYLKVMNLKGNTWTLGTDYGHFIGDISGELKIKILCLDPHQRTGPFLKDAITERSLSSDYYHIKTKTGQYIHRFCLSYLIILNRCV